MTSKFTSLIVLLLFPCLVPVFSQTRFQTEYYPSIDGPVLIDTSGGGYVLAGTCVGGSGAGLDGMMMWLNDDGSFIGAKNFGMNGDERFVSLIKRRNGNIVAAGSTSSYVFSPSDVGNFYLVETDLWGTQLSAKSIGTTNNDFAWSVKETADSGLIIAGVTDSAGKSRPYLIKLDPSNHIQWSRIYTNNSYDVNVARSVVQTTDGGFAFTGYSTHSTASADTILFIVKTDSAGAVTAAKHFSFTDANYVNPGSFGYDIIQNSAGNLVVAGGAGGFYQSVVHIFMSLLIETQANLTVVRSKTFSLNSGDCRSLSVQQCPDQGYILGGYMGNYYLSMIKASSSMITDWCYHYDNNFSPQGFGYCARNTADGGYILSGALIAGTHSRVVKTNSAGTSGCAEAVPIGPGGVSSDVTLAESVPLWTSFSNADTVSATPVSHALPVTTTVICGTVANETSLKAEQLEIYPNPCKSILYVDSDEAMDLYVFNSIGETMTLKMNSGSDKRRHQLDISGLIPGVYFLKAGEKVARFVKE